jgi:4-hydroxy-tetrahydrodipicolinate synthase
MPALVTPFTKDGDIMEDSFNKIIDYTIERGATGVVPVGTTGEFVYMRTEERKKLLKLTVDYVDGRVPIVAGTGQNSTRATVELTKYAADIGCDAALIISSFFLRPDDKGYYEHYETVARLSDFPIIIYNIPQVTLGTLGSNLVQDLAEIDNIVGIKDSGGVIGHTVELIQKLNGKIPVIIGHDECFLSAIAAGADAAILASGNIIPHIWLEIMDKIRTGKHEDAAKMQQSVQTLARLVTRNGGAPPVKAALKMIGIDAGKSRMPLDSGGTLSVELKEEIRVELEKLGVIDNLAHPPITEHVDISSIIKDFGFGIESDEVKVAAGKSESVSVGIAVGPKNSPLGRAFVKLLTTPKIGQEALTVILEPNLAVRPSTLMLPLKQIKSMRQASFFYGPVQSGAAKGIAQHLISGHITEEIQDTHVMIMALDVDLNSLDRRSITYATEEAVSAALTQIWG